MARYAPTDTQKNKGRSGKGRPFSIRKQRRYARVAQTIEHLPNGLTLRQDDRYFKLGQDSVLLSAFAKPRRGARLLDLGCCTAPT